MPSDSACAYVDRVRRKQRKNEEREERSGMIHTVRRSLKNRAIERVVNWLIRRCD